jgi:ribonuclease P protein component
VPRIAREITRFARAEVDQLFGKATRVLRSPAFDMLRALRQKEFGRVLIVISRKVGNAPDRNKVRRRMRSVFYEAQVYKQPYDWVVLVKKQAVSSSFDELKKLLLGGFTK